MAEDNAVALRPIPTSPNKFKALENMEEDADDLLDQQLSDELIPQFPVYALYTFIHTAKS